MKPFSFIVSVLVSAFVASPAACDFDLKILLDRAAHQLAKNLDTSVNHYRLAQGLCFSREDASANNECSKQPTGTQAPRSRFPGSYTALILEDDDIFNSIRTAFKLSLSCTQACACQ